MSALAVVGIIYGALMSMIQKDIKSLVAYSSVSHLGAVMLGIFALNLAGVQGSIIQMVNHGLSTGALFLIVGMIYERRHTRMIEDFGGLSKQVPVLGAFFLIVTLSSIGLPGLNGFVGEFLVLWGAFQARTVYGVLGATGVVLSAAYMLWMFRRVMHGESKPENKALKDLSGREIAVLVPVIIVILLIGIFPKPFLTRTESSAQRLLSQVVQVQETTVGKVGR
jgi:NADH-quinone oxidoreductase subunit M